MGRTKEKEYVLNNKEILKRQLELLVMIEVLADEKLGGDKNIS